MQIIQYKDLYTVASAHKPFGEEGHSSFLHLELVIPAQGRNRIGSPQPPSASRGPSNQGSAGRGGTEWRALCFLLYLPLLISAWRKFMLSLCLRKSAKPAGDRYLPGVCRPRRPSLQALGTMRYPPLPGQGVPASSLPPGAAPPGPARDLWCSRDCRLSSSPESPSLARLPCVFEPSIVFLSLESRCVQTIPILAPLS